MSHSPLLLRIKHTHSMKIYHKKSHELRTPKNKYKPNICLKYQKVISHYIRSNRNTNHPPLVSLRSPSSPTWLSCRRTVTNTPVLADDLSWCCQRAGSPTHTRPTSRLHCRVSR